MKNTIDTNTATALRADARRIGDNLKTSSWDLAEVLYKVFNWLTRDANNEVVKVYESYGFTSKADYLRSDVDIGQSTAHQLVKVYRVFIVGNKHAPRSRTFPIYKLQAMLGVVTPDNTTVWLDFADSHTIKQIQAAAAMAVEFPSLADNPEKAFARSERKAAKAPGEHLSLTGLTKRETDAIDLCVAIARTAMKQPKMSPAKATAACLIQFANLVRSGRAGVGWSEG